MERGARRARDGATLWAAAGIAVWAAACGAERSLPLEPICGEASARRMLELPAKDEVERIVVDRDRDEVLFGVVTPDESVPSMRIPIAVQVTDMCGDDVRTLAEGARLHTAPGVRPQLCEGGARLRPASDDGAAPIDAIDCEVAGTDLGLVVLAPSDASGQGDLVLHPAGGGAAGVLASGVVHAAWRMGRAWWAAGGEAIALGVDGRVLALDLVGGEPGVVAEGIADLVVSGDGRWLVAQAGDEPSTPSAVSVIDRETGERHELADALLGANPLPFFGPWLALREAVGAPYRVFALEGGDELPLPDGTSFVREAPGGRAWLHAVDAPYGHADERAWDPGSGAIATLYAGPGIPSFADGGLEIFVPSDDAGIQRGTVLSIPWTGGDAVTLAEDVGWQRLRVGDDGRFVSVRQTKDDPPLGELYLHDPLDPDPIRIADDVLAPSIHLSRSDPFDGDLVWISEDDAGRTLWRIRVPPRAE